jgi:aerobic C4-dicarboxylate transport protein
MRLAGLSIFKFLNYLREELTIVLGTSSSDAVLPQIMKKLERMRPFALVCLRRDRRAGLG